jgi:hypothetical protein
MRKILTSVCLLISFGIQSASAQSVPDNAHRSLLGGWVCDRGYERIGDHCRKLDVPEHASLDLTGHDWRCDRGYHQVGQTCQPLDVPENASLDITGNDWRCNRGYRQAGQRCVQIEVPEHASLDITGRDWNCDRGYKRVGDTCTKIDIPEHASLSYFGNGWVCNEGYLKRGDGCLPVERATDEEIRELIISNSIARYPGSCPCPYNTDSAGRRCGERSAYSRSGGHSPICYKRNIPDDLVSRYRRKY